ncbi:MAG: glycoside hydrolase family 43 protein [Clostridia bacterium]|nr:glycoside hydrolase family 43 protein [Clostridia bacterium]
MKRLCLAMLFIALWLTLPAFAQERYEIKYTFDDATVLQDFSYDGGKWTVEDGKLRTTTGTGSTVMTYDIPTAYAGMDFDVDVDFIGHTSTGGINVGGVFDGMPGVPTTFFGYDCFIGTDGTKAALGCYDEAGAWKGNIIVGQSNIDDEDLHLTVAVRGNTLTYRVFSLDKQTQYFGIAYTVGQSSLDVYNAFSGKVGLRKAFADQGRFDNFAVTVYPDVLPGEMSEENAPQDFSLTCKIVPENRTFIFFGMQDEENGYALVVDKPYEKIGLYAVKDGKYQFLSEKKCPLADAARDLKLSVTDGIVRVYYQDNPLVDMEEDYPKIELPLDDYTAGRFGVMNFGGDISDLTLAAEGPDPVEDGYLNPVTDGADPDVLFYEGTYYMYNRISAGKKIFAVSFSPDLVHWSEKSTVFVKESGYTATGYMSPNVFYYDGIFYLFYAAKNEAGSERLYCATATSPLGPFTHKDGQVPLHDVSEIGGHPFLDDDGRFYLTYVRFGKGNAIWIEEAELKDGNVTFVEDTLRELIVPQYEYEINGLGRCCEGGVIKKHNGYYYMIYATGVYNSDYGESYAVAEDILGPYTRYAYNDILASNARINGVGDGIFVSSPDGRELFMVYHCHKDTATVSPRQTCIDRVRFVEDPDGGPDILQISGPTVNAQAMPSNIYRYDINRDGKCSLADALVCVRMTANAETYDGRCDVNGDLRNSIADTLELVRYMLTNYRQPVDAERRDNSSIEG